MANCPSAPAFLGYPPFFGIEFTIGFEKASVYNNNFATVFKRNKAYLNLQKEYSWIYIAKAINTL